MSLKGKLYLQIYKMYTKLLTVYILKIQNFTDNTKIPANLGIKTTIFFGKFNMKEVNYRSLIQTNSITLRIWYGV